MRADAARNHAAILEASRELIASVGMDFTMEQVASAAGVGMGTVYRRFPDRAALLHTVVTDLIADVSARLDAAEGSVADSDDPVLRWNTLYAALADSPLPRLLPHLFEASSNRDVFDEETIQGRSQVLARMKSALAAAQAAQGIRADITLLDVALLTAAALRPMPEVPPRLMDTMAPRLRALLAAALAPSATILPGQGIQPEVALAMAQD